MSTSGSGMVSGSELIGRALALEGVKNVFTVAGDHVLLRWTAWRIWAFGSWNTRHEQAAAHMADAWGRITGEPGVSMYTTPGFSNAIPGLANAMHSESPLLSISGSAELSELGRGAMQEIDQVGMARPVTKGAWMVTDTRRIPRHDRACAASGVQRATRTCASDDSGGHTAECGGARMKWRSMRQANIAASGRRRLRKLTLSMRLRYCAGLSGRSSWRGARRHTRVPARHCRSSSRRLGCRC